jgi:HlyD family secretion protein
MTSASAKEIAAISSVTNYMVGGIIIVFLMVFGIGGWAATTEIAGAVIAPGTVVVESAVKKVQHPNGGVVGEIFIKEGSKVHSGDLLLKLDETLTRANLQMVTKQLDALLMREARLEAERDDLQQVALPAAYESRKNEPEIEKIFSGERSLFVTRRDSRIGQKAQLKERIDQLQEEIAGITGQITAKTTEIELIGQEIKAAETLEAKQLTTTEKMTRLRRDAARLRGEFGELRSAAAQSKGKIAEVELQILRIDQDAKTEVVKELRETQSKIAEYNERRIAAEDQLRRVEIRAPQSGIVHQLAVHTVGGVVNQGEPIMLIVPENDRLMVDTRISPQSIDQVRPGQSALLRFSAFNLRTTPEIIGKVNRVAADLSRDEKTGETYFLTRVELSEAELAKLGDKKLVPGMPADVQIRTDDRTVLSYLLKPIEDQVSKAFRER